MITLRFRSTLIRTRHGQPLGPSRREAARCSLADRGLSALPTSLGELASAPIPTPSAAAHQSPSMTSVARKFRAFLASTATLIASRRSRARPSQRKVFPRHPPP